MNLQHLDKNTITSETSLTQGGLGLDSVDILEVVVTIEHRYEIKISNAEVGQKALRNFGSLADFLLQNQVTQK